MNLLNKGKVTKVARSLVIKAGDKVAKIYPNIQKIKDKNLGNDILTTADIESEKIIVSGIRKHFPEHSTFSEEEGLNTLSSDYKWFIDPLDGSKHIIKGLPYFCVTLGVTYKSEVILGITYIPLLNQYFEARKGEGAYLNDKKIYISELTKPEKSIINVEFPSRNFKVKWSSDEYKKSFLEFEKLIKNIFRVRMIGSGPIGLAYTAMGGYDAYVRFQPYSIEDIIAGYLLIKEAGGTISDFEGNNIDLLNYNSKFIASNKFLSKEIIKIISETDD
jgi:myo-inositol-1(or 4)-monophosphatase